MLLYARASVLPDYRAPGTPVFLYHREQNRLSCSRDNLGRHPREQNKPFRSRDNLGKHPREQNKPFRSRGNLSRYPREQNKPFLLTRQPQQVSP